MVVDTPNGKFFPMRGFTIIELIIFSAIFSILMISFISILVAVTSVHNRQIGASEVNQQSQFLLQQIQYHVERASMIQLEPDSATSTLKLRMPGSAEDPTYIYLSGNVAYIKQTESGEPQALTSDKVLVSDLVFTKRSNPPGHDSVSVSMVVAFNTQNLARQFVGSLQTAVARVSAATFDSDIRASTTNTHVIGASNQEWKSINGTIYFSGANVGIGVSFPSSKLQVSGGDVYIDDSAYGIIFRNSGSGGECLKIRASNGNLATSSVSCP